MQIYVVNGKSEGKEENILWKKAFLSRDQAERYVEDTLTLNISMSMEIIDLELPEVSMFDIPTLGSVTCEKEQTEWDSNVGRVAEAVSELVQGPHPTLPAYGDLYKLMIGVFMEFSVAHYG